MANLIPPINARGRYTVASPYSLSTGVIYQCTAIRRFVDLENQGVDVLRTYYEPYELTSSKYRQDKEEGAAIITLTSDTHSPVYIPSTYITSYPDQAYRDYHHVVLSASLGALPDYIDLSNAMTQMQNVISDVVGVSTEVHLSVAPLTERVTPEEHEVLETNRDVAIENRTTDYARVLERDEIIQRLEARLAVAEEILRSKDLIPE